MDILARLNWIDVIVIILMIRISYVAFQDGLSHEIFPLFGVICTVVLALHYYNIIGVFLSQNVVFVNKALAAFIVFLCLVIVIGLIFKILRRVVDLILKVSWHPAIEKFGGLVIGVMKASVIVSTVLIILALIPLPYVQWSIRDRSLTGMPFLRIGPEIYVRAAALLPASGSGKTAAPAADKLVENIVRDKSASTENNKKVDNRPNWEKELQKDLTLKPSSK